MTTSQPGARIDSGEFTDPEMVEEVLVAETTPDTTAVSVTVGSVAIDVSVDFSIPPFGSGGCTTNEQRI